LFWLILQGTQKAAVVVIIVGQSSSLDLDVTVQTWQVEIWFPQEVLLNLDKAFALKD